MCYLFNGNWSVCQSVDLCGYVVRDEIDILNRIFFFFVILYYKAMSASCVVYNI